MLSYITKSYGPAARFESINLAEPKPQNNEVLIEVKAAGLNLLDNYLLRHNSALNPELPATLHGEVAGRIAAIGTGVHRFEIGEDVFGYAGGLYGHSGAIADYMTADARLLAYKPRSLNYTQAAALPFAVITAWDALFNGCELQPDEHILISDALSDIGHIALQLAKHHGAKVTASVPAATYKDTARKLGADEIITDESDLDHIRQITGGKGFSVIFDSCGNSDLSVIIQSLSYYGRLATFSPVRTQHNIDLFPFFNAGCRVYFVNPTIPILHDINMEQYSEILQTATRLVDQGKLHTIINEPYYKFAEINKAHNDFETSRHHGKIVLINE